VLIQKIAAMASAGVDWVQLREKDLSARELTKLVREALRIAATPRAASPDAMRILVNDRVDIALAEQAHGVHLGENSLPAQEVRRLVAQTLLFTPSSEGLGPARSAPKTFLLGASCHSLETAKAAAQNGAGYIFFGPIFATPAKASFGAPQGLNRLGEICRAVSIPVLAIGGITLKNAASCFEAGAAGIAAIGLFQASTDPVATIATLRKMAG
jgi:thiamine-phosphate pyrophosphorylase